MNTPIVLLLFRFSSSIQQEKITGNFYIENSYFDLTLVCFILAHYLPSLVFTLFAVLPPQVFYLEIQQYYLLYNNAFSPFFSIRFQEFYQGWSRALIPSYMGKTLTSFLFGFLSFIQRERITYISGCITFISNFFP